MPGRTCPASRTSSRARTSKPALRCSRHSIERAPATSAGAQARVSQQAVLERNRHTSPPPPPGSPVTVARSQPPSTQSAAERLSESGSGVGGTPGGSAALSGSLGPGVVFYRFR